MQLLKSIRNAIADCGAQSVARIPSLEKSFVAMGRLYDPIPVLRTVYLRAIETYCKLLKQQGKQFRQINLGDQSFLFDITDFTAISLFFRGQMFEPATTKYLLECDLTDGIVLDIGANRGYISILSALKSGPKGRVYSFEPNPTVHRELQHHVHLNGLSERIFLSSLALSDESDQRVTFYLSNVASNTGLSSLTPQPDLLASKALTKENTIEVTTITLDLWLERNQIHQPIDLIKIDVEGAENKVLGGATKTLATIPPKRWIIETKIESNVREFMSDRGYHTEILDTADDSVNLLCTLP